MNRTLIEWTHWTVNPFKMRMPDGTLINSCVHKSAGCAACYAEGIVGRFWRKEWGGFPGYTAALLKLGTPVLVEEELRAVLRLSKRITEGKADPEINKVFWNDMTDEYLDFWPDEFIDKCWAVRAFTPNLIHQVLTKRADRLHHYFKNRFTRHYAAKEASTFTGKYDGATGTCDSAICNAEFPYPNVHLGVSVEDQKTADERIPLLLQTPAAVRWISAEPLLAETDITEYLGWNKALDNKLDWVVVGGESGPGARSLDLAWIKSIVEQCQAASVPVFVKQLGYRPWWDGVSTKAPNPYIYLEQKTFNGKSGWQFDRMQSRKGGDPSEWPIDLRVREFPSVETPKAI